MKSAAQASFAESKTSLQGALSNMDVNGKASLVGSKELIDSENELNNEVDPKVELRNEEVEADMLELSSRVEAIVVDLKEQSKLPVELLQKGLSSIGPAPDTQRRVFQRLSLPVTYLANWE
jgi:DNA replication protein DnaD